MKDTRLKNCFQIDNHRRKMGLHQKFKSTKIKKEKQSNFSAVETQVRNVSKTQLSAILNEFLNSQLKLHKSYRFMVGIFLVIATTIIATIYIRLQSECEENGGNKSENASYCRVYNQIQRFFTMCHTKISSLVRRII